MAASGSVLAVRATSRLFCRPWLRHASKFAQEMAAEEEGARGSLLTWKRISLFVAVPVVGYLTWQNFIAHPEHPEQREYVPWPHLRIRNKPFPWGDGDTSLMNNPLANPSPEPQTAADEDAPPKEFIVTRLWREYLFEDPDKRDEIRYDHLRKMQLRREEYLRKKSAGQKRIQPMDLFTETKHTPRQPWDSEIDN